VYRCVVQKPTLISLISLIAQISQSDSLIISRPAGATTASLRGPQATRADERRCCLVRL